MTDRVPHVNRPAPAAAPGGRLSSGGTYGEHICLESHIPMKVAHCMLKLRFCTQRGQLLVETSQRPQARFPAQLNRAPPLPLGRHWRSDQPPELLKSCMHMHRKVNPASVSVKESVMVVSTFIPWPWTNQANSMHRLLFLVTVQTPFRPSAKS